MPALTALALAVPHAQAAAPLIQATKTDALLTDVNNNGQANPGDTLRYTVTIQNAGSADASGAQFSDTIDANTTLVPGSITATPVAANDAYSTVGNVQLSVAAAGVLANDVDPDGTGGLTVAGFSVGSANGGNVIVAADGSFTYNPPAGFSGTDTFTYTVNDAEGNIDGATVSITVGQVVWFIDNAAGAGGDGRFTAPFDSISAFNSGAADDPGDYIFVYQGSGAYSGTLTLLTGQQLIGHGVGLSISPNLSIASASRPTVADIVLASGNTVRGLNSSTSSGTSISGASVGALTMNNVSVTNSGGIGVSLSGGNSSMAVTFDSVSSSGGANGIVLTNNSGSFTSNGGTIDPTTGHGIQVSNTAVGPLNFTLTNSTVTGAPAGFNGINFEIPTSGSFGNVNVTSNAITNNGNIGLLADIQGAGSITKIDVGSNTFSGNPTGVTLATNGTASVDFDVHNNPTISATNAGVIIAADDAVPNNGSGPTMEGYVRNNASISASTAGPSIALRVVSAGDGNITTDINNNNITNYGNLGIDVESLGGTGDVHARIASNTASTSTMSSGEAVFLRSGATAGDTNLLCANLAPPAVPANDMNAAAGNPGVPDYRLARPNPTSALFQLQGLSPPSATNTQAQTYVQSTDPGSAAIAATGTYTAATCTLVSFVSPQPSPQLQARAAAAATGPDRARSTASPSTGETVNLGPLSLSTLNPGQTVTITFDVTINSPLPTGVTSVCNQGTISSNGPNVLTDDPDVVGASDPTCTPVSPPTAARAAFADARRTGRGAAVVRWRTASEVGILGFEVYRERSGKRVRVGSRLIPAAGGAGGHLYAATDRRLGRGPARYRVVAVALDGARSTLATVRLR